MPLGDHFLVQKTLFSSTRRAADSTGLPSWEHPQCAQDACPRLVSGSKKNPGQQFQHHISKALVFLRQQEASHWPEAVTAAWGPEVRIQDLDLGAQKTCRILRPRSHRTQSCSQMCAKNLTNWSVHSSHSAQARSKCLPANLRAPV